MIRLAARTVIAVLANAVALIAGALLLDDMTLDGVAFLIALLLFTVTGILIEPLMRQVAIKNAPVLLGSSSLIATLVSLIITAIFSDGLQISGLSTWVLATIIVWGVALIARLLLPLIIFKKVLSGASERRSQS